jgi:putative endonuclease
MSWYLYLIECADGSVYTGITTDVATRFDEHAAGKGARYTRSRKPRAVLASFPLADRSSASRAEYWVKQLSAAQKRELAAGLRTLESVLPPAPASDTVADDGMDAAACAVESGDGADTAAGESGERKDATAGATKAGKRTSATARAIKSDDGANSTAGASRSRKRTGATADADVVAPARAHSAKQTSSARRASSKSRPAPSTEPPPAAAPAPAQRPARRRAAHAAETPAPAPNTRRTKQNRAAS